MYIEGCHSTIFILETSALTNCPGWTRRCMQTFLERCRRCKCGLADSHLALVADSTHHLLSTHQVQLGVWSPVRQLVHRAPRPARRRWDRGKGQRSRPAPRPLPPSIDVHYNFTLLHEMMAALDSYGRLPGTSSEQPEQAMPPSHNRSWDRMARQLHALLDKPPWSPEENTIIDVHWLLGGDPVPFPCTAASLSGVLLRLKMWHNAYLQIVTCTIPSDRESSEEWFDAVEARVCTADTWSDGLGDIWRGNLHFTERMSSEKPACRQMVVFPGFSLTLHDVPTPTSDDVTAAQLPIVDVTKASTVGDDVTKLRTVCEPTVDDDVTKVSTLDDEPRTIVDDVSKISTFGDDVTKRRTVGDDVTKVSAVSDDVTNASTVGDDVTKMSTLGDDVIKASAAGDDVVVSRPDSDAVTAVPPITKMPPLNYDNITLGSDVIAMTSAILKGVGLPEESATPTHLEMVQIIDTTTMPTLWISPLHCTLSLKNTSHGDSVLLFPKIFKRRETGMLVRLCFADLANKPQPKPKTTADWYKYIQSVSEDEFCSSPTYSQLAAYETGPVLGVFQSKGGQMSCDAWFLWRPEVINTEPCLDVPNIKESTVKESVTPPQSGITENKQADIDCKLVVDDLMSSAPVKELRRKAASQKSVLDIPPSEMPEIKALKTYEWVQRKLVRHTTTPDLVFGQLVAPPPPSSSTATKSGLSAGDVLECFHETGSPATSELSPITNDMSDIVKVHNPSTSGDGVPSFESVAGAAGSQGNKRRYHGVNYCLQAEDSSMDARLTRIQQRYLLSERASNCSSSNTPDVKLEQRRQQRMRRARTDPRGEEGEGRGGGEAGGWVGMKGKGVKGKGLKGKWVKGSVMEGKGLKSGGTREEDVTGDLEMGSGTQSDGVAVQRLELTVKGAEELEKLERQGENKGKEKRSGDIETSISYRDRTASDGEQVGERESPILLKASSTAVVAATPSRKRYSVQSGVKLSKSPVLKLNRVQTPPSATRPASLLSRLKGKQCTSKEQHQDEPTTTASAVETPRLALTVNDGSGEQSNTAQRTAEVSDVLCSPGFSESTTPTRTCPRKRLELTLSDATAQSSGSVESETGTKLRRSPRKNKWIAGKKSSSIPPVDIKQASHKGKSYKKKLEQIIVVSLKKKGMQRDHVCFRKCYNRLFNLSKSFLKDVRSSKALVSEMHRVVDFNVSQVIDFELRQANTSL